MDFIMPINIFQWHRRHVFILCRYSACPLGVKIYTKQISAYAVGCRYNAVQYYMILHIPLQWLGQNTNKSLNTQIIPHSNGRAMGCFFRILEKIDRVITAPHCIYIHLQNYGPYATYYNQYLYAAVNGVRWRNWYMQKSRHELRARKE